MARTKQTSRKHTGTLYKNVVSPDQESGVKSDGISSASCLTDAVTQTGERSSSPGDVISDLLLLKENLLDCVKNINAVVNHVSRQVRCPRPASSGLDSQMSDEITLFSRPDIVLTDFVVPPVGQLRYSSPEYRTYCPPQSSSPSDRSGRLGNSNNRVTGRGFPFASFRSSVRGGGRKVRELFITKVSRSTSDQDFLDFVSRHVRPVNFQRISHPSAYHASFLLTVSDIDVSSVMNPDIWPVGVECRYFKRPVSGWLANENGRSLRADGQGFDCR